METQVVDSGIPLQGYADKVAAKSPMDDGGYDQVTPTIRYYRNLIQGSDAWKAARCGLLTASEMRLVYRLPKEETRKKKNGEPYKQREYTPSENDAERAHLYELLGQRITRYVEPTYFGDDMLRGTQDEIDARDTYSKHYAPVETIGFITNNIWGFTLGYSPDGLVGKDGLIEAKSRKQKLQVKALVDYVAGDTIDPDFIIQVQTGLLVSERKWCDLITYCGGLPMATVRVFPIPKIQEAILTAATEFEARIAVAQGKFNDVLASDKRLIPTERKIIEVMV